MMLSASHRNVMQTKGVVIGRVLLGFMFFFSGVGILLGDPTNTAGFYDSLGLPLAGLLVWLVIILKIGAGGALMLGKCVGKASAVLIGFTLLATLIAHTDIEDPNLFKNLAIVGGLLYVIAFGPGKWNDPVADTSTESNEQPHI
jgi:putative oxidoreductase